MCACHLLSLFFLSMSCDIFSRRYLFLKVEKFHKRDENVSKFSTYFSLFFTNSCALSANIFFSFFLYSRILTHSIRLYCVEITDHHIRRKNFVFTNLTERKMLTLSHPLSFSLLCFDQRKFSNEKLFSTLNTKHQCCSLSFNFFLLFLS